MSQVSCRKVAKRIFSRGPCRAVLKLCWIDVYFGPSEIVKHDTGKNFMARSYISNEDLLKVETK